MLNLSVVPLDGSPALTTADSSSPPNAALGTPALTASDGNGNYAAAWLTSSIAGLTGNATLGTLTVTIPANATSSAAYAIHFDHASASPNGLASFPKQTLTGLITLSTAPIPATTMASPIPGGCAGSAPFTMTSPFPTPMPAGDGINNWQKYVAGTDPTRSQRFSKLESPNPAPAGAAAAIYWPTVSGKQYVIERSASLFPGNWTTIAIVTGTGTNMEFDDSTGASARFYRVRILP